MWWNFVESKYLYLVLHTVCTQSAATLIAVFYIIVKYIYIIFHVSSIFIFSFRICFFTRVVRRGVWQLCQTAPMRQYSQECYELNQVVSIFCLSKWIWVLEEFEVAHWKRHWLTDSSSGFQSSITSHVLHGLHEGTLYHNSIFSKQGNVSYWAKIYIIYVN